MGLYLISIIYYWQQSHKLTIVLDEPLSTAISVRLLWEAPGLRSTCMFSPSSQSVSQDHISSRVLHCIILLLGPNV